MTLREDSGQPSSFNVLEANGQEDLLIEPGIDCDA